ncbi:MAG: LysR family transcriptional regulator [Bacilli bacterium]|nr:LysR family transcriptional regulator [Bacilli bacterium]
MNTDYNLYKIFLYLYEEKSISKTAAKLYVSQPAISYSLKELENQLGYTLFYRNSKGIEPTLEAKELYSYISTAFNILNDAEEHIKNLNSLNIGCIRIGTPSHIGVFYLSKYISDFRKIYPGIRFDIVCKSTSEMVEMLETRKLDIIVDTLPINSKKQVTKVTLSKLQNCFAYNKKMMKDVHVEKVEDLKNYPLVLPSATSSIRLKLDEFMESQNTKLLPVLESWTTEIMIEMVREGVGIGYFVKNVIDTQSDKDDFAVITFKDELPAVDVCCVYIDDFLTTATHKFVDLLVSNKIGE